MNAKAPPPPDARKEPGHSREEVHLEDAHRRPGQGGGAPRRDTLEQADGYADDVKNPPGSHQRRG